MPQVAETHGLSAAEARARLRADGPNSLPGAMRRGTLQIAFGVLREPMFLLLCAATGIYLLLGDVAEALVLAASVLVVLAITVVQEQRSERALEALRDLSSPRALVVRDGEPQRIAGIDVVRGDLIVLAEGDRVPADARLIDTNDLLVDESLLTGESLPVEKRAQAEGDARELHVYSGTLVAKGQGRGRVIATGARTEMGRIGVSLATMSTEKTALERETARIVKLIAILALALSVAVALLYFAMRGNPLAATLAGLTLAMAILPEEFPVVLTVFLALGAWRISRHGVLTRRMPAVEMLGAATVLCVDKTGTLTENRMAVAEVYAAGGWRALPHASAMPYAHVLETAALACEVEPFDPMERAILSGAGQAAPAAIEHRMQWRLDHDYPMSPEFPAVCHAWRTQHGAAHVAIKGAPEAVLALCALEEAARAAALGEAESAAARGLRLLGVAQAQWDGKSWPDTPRSFAFRWLGFIALADPLRASVPEAVAQCRRAGIRVVMITGDYAATALAIAQQAGIATDDGILTGNDIALASDAELARVVRNTSVFARVLPEQKLRLVAAYKAAGEVVAMTGDGVNDAPALRAAHIGIAMGLRGTDVAREAAALVLLEDDFGSIVETVRLGRRIYTNIRNAMSYIVAVHVPIAGMAFLPLAFGWPLLLFPVHVVFLEFVIDPACSIVFEAEKSASTAMNQPPRSPAEPLFSAAMLTSSIAVGLTMLAAVAAVYWWAANSGRSDTEVRSIGFAAIVCGNIALILAHRSRERTILATLGRPNPALWWIVAGTLAALGTSIYWPAAAGVFRFSPLAPLDLLISATAGAASVLWLEVSKLRRGAASRS